jgi:hypothetical protein
MDTDAKHNAALAMAIALLVSTGHRLRPYEHGEAFQEFYRVCRDGIETYLRLDQIFDVRIELEGD